VGGLMPFRLIMAEIYTGRGLKDLTVLGLLGCYVLFMLRQIVEINLDDDVKWSVVLVTSMVLLIS